MNYRHSYHAGNFADVLKHVVLALSIAYFRQKATPFRVIDTHAGVGAYDLHTHEAQKTGEWEAGIGRLLASPLPEPVTALLEPYLAVIAKMNPDGALRHYPGSPLLARHLMRPTDILVANELHPEDHELLEELFARDPATKVMSIDGYSALRSLLPPKERRGIVLVDPPFEEPGELQRLVRGLKDAAQRFATGTVILWYPIKDERAVQAFHRDVAALGLQKVLAVELTIRGTRNPDLLNGTGLVILNPPYPLRQQLELMLPVLSERLAQGPGAAARLDWISPERA